LTWKLQIFESVETHLESSGPEALMSVAEEMNFLERCSLWLTTLSYMQSITDLLQKVITVRKVLF
jgi:hypothetical protein